MLLPVWMMAGRVLLKTNDLYNFAVQQEVQNSGIQNAVRPSKKVD